MKSGRISLICIPNGVEDCKGKDPGIQEDLPQFCTFAG